jgi:hypothetical protein
MSVHIIGDSHVLSFVYVPGFAVHHLGEVKAFSIDDWEPNFLSYMTRFPAQADEPWLVSAGEIDCRVTIYDGAVEGFSLGKRIEMAVGSYVMFLDKLQGAYQFNAVALAVPPQGYQHNYYNVARYAERVERQRITTSFNHVLGIEAPLMGLRVFDPWESIERDAYGLVPKELFMPDGVHLREDVVTRLVEPEWEKFCNG